MITERPRWRSRALRVTIILMCLIGVLLTLVGVDHPADAVNILAVAGALVAAIMIWAQVRLRTERREFEQALAAWVTERATQAERLRIAADLHDLVSHGLGLITVRAAAAHHISGTAADREKENALADIEHIGRETTTELRRMLTVLRDPGIAPLRPPDTLNDLPAILQAAHTAGLTARLDIDELADASQGVQLTVCAIVREALNNTLRHVGPTNVWIRLHHEGAIVVLEIQDAGPQGEWQSQPGSGLGLHGLRERVSSLGGTFEASQNEHGFHIIAELPDRECT